MDNSLKLVMFLYVLTCISVGFNITLMRQIFGFIYLSFIPGYLFLKILKLSDKDHLETVVFSVGLSIAFLMFLGLFLNHMFPTFNLSKPLNTIPLMITVSGLTLILFLLSYREKNKEAKPLFLGNANVITILQICSLSVLPVLSIVGALYHNTSLLLFMILGVTFLCAISIFSDRVVSEKILPLAIASISVALLFHTALISKHLIGSPDCFNEFYVFKLTQIQGYWHSPGPIIYYSLIDTLNSILSITVLPTVYTAVLAIDGEIFFKLFYPFVFSLVPIALYKMYEQQTGRKVAFLSVFYYMSVSIVFYGLEPIGLARQITGCLFFILCIYLITDKRLALAQRRVLLIIFGAALIVSFYSVAYIFLFYIVLLFVISRVLILLYRKASTHVLSLGLVLLLIAITFLWYIYVSNSPLNQLSNSIDRITSSIHRDLFSFRGRGFGEGALHPLSPMVPTSLIGMIHKALIYLEHFFIGIGIIVLIIKPKEFSLNQEFRLVALISMVFFSMGLIIPYFSATLNMTRFYAIVIPFLAPFVVLGGTFLFRFVGKSVASLLPKLRKFPVKNLELYMVTCMLITTFLFQVGFVSHVTGGYPYSYSLDLDRRERSSDLSIRASTHGTYFLDQEVFSARWLLENANPKSKVYAGWNSRSTILKAYTLVPDDRILGISNETVLESRAYIYLKYLNVGVGVISTVSETHNTSGILPLLRDCNMIYSNGNSDIYFSP